MLDLKRQIAVLKGYPSSEPELTAPKTAIKLIHLGKILTDDVKIAETVIPPSFLVMMPPKVATPPQPSRTRREVVLQPTPAHRTLHPTQAAFRQPLV